MSYLSYTYDFGICAIFQNEAPYLKEWIEYHRIVGAKYFYLYNNFSQDNYLTVLQPYLEEGIVELVDWIEPDFQIYGQRMAYMDAIYKARGNVKWLAIIDIDEYLVPKSDATVPKFLTQFEKEGIGGVGINWQMFGTSYVQAIKENQLLTELLILKAEEEHGENKHIKSIVRPEYVIEPPGVHHFSYCEDYFQVDTNQEIFTGPISPHILTDKMQINHYWTKDETFFNSVKIPRRLNWGELMEEIENRRSVLNQVKDLSIEPYLPALRQSMFSKHETVTFSHLDKETDIYDNSYQVQLAKNLKNIEYFTSLIKGKNGLLESQFRSEFDLGKIAESLSFFPKSLQHSEMDISGHTVVVNMDKEPQDYREIAVQKLSHIYLPENGMSMNPWTFFYISCMMIGMVGSLLWFRKTKATSEPMCR